MDNLTVNSLIEWTQPTQTEPEIERILQIDSGSAVVFNVIQNKGIPRERRIEELETAVQTGKAKILHTDPWIIPVTQDVLEGHIKKRDRAWEIIKPIVETPGYLTDTCGRAKAIQRATAQSSEKHIYHLLRKFWRGGQTISALLPLYRNCGRPGTSRSGKTKKTGPKPRSQHSPGKTLTEQDLKNIDRGITRFYETAAKRSIVHAHRETLGLFYNQGLIPKNGTIVPVLKESHELPSLAQFRYRLKTTKNPATLLLKRKGQRRFNLENRAVLRHHNVPGPGSHYAMDFTIGDVHLVSSINQDQAIGKPTIYLVADYFSHMVTGFHITLENGSYNEAALALENAASDKAQFCRHHGVEISPEEWPASHIPKAILADRGELRGPIANPIVHFRIRLDNTPPYRPDLKALVERAFQSLNTDLLHKLPGRVQKNQSRGDENPAKRASLTLPELTKAVILWIRAHNHKPLSEFHPNRDMADITPTPIDLWRWGIANRSGSLRTFPADYIRSALLPSGEASITRHGIRFQGYYYNCATAQENQWFVLANGKQSTVTCHYDPRDASILYIQTGKGALEQCQLINQDSLAHSTSWQELESFRIKQIEKKEKANVTALQLAVELNAAISSLTPKQPKKNKIKNIRSARQTEIALTQRHPAPQSTNIVAMPAYECEDEVEAAQLQILQNLA